MAGHEYLNDVDLARTARACADALVELKVVTAPCALGLGLWWEPSKIGAQPAFPVGVRTVRSLELAEEFTGGAGSFIIDGYDCKNALSVERVVLRNNARDDGAREQKVRGLAGVHEREIRVDSGHRASAYQSYRGGRGMTRDP